LYNSNVINPQDDSYKWNGALCDRFVYLFSELLCSYLKDRSTFLTDEIMGV